MQTIPVDVHKLAFLEYVGSIRHSWLKILAFLGFTLVPLFLILDYILNPPEFFLEFVIYRVSVSVLVLGEFFIIAYTKPSKYDPLYGYFFSLLVGLMISVMTQRLGGFNSSYYAGLNLVTIAVIALIPWNNIHAIMNAIFIILGYLVINAFFSHPYDIKIAANNLFFLFSTAVIALAINQVRYQLIRKEFYSNVALDIARKEQDTIMNSVEEGLFIIHDNEGIYFIGDHISESIKMILGDTSLLGKKFTDVLAEYFPENKIIELTEFLQMISTRNLDDEMIKNLNPLERVCTTFQSGMKGITKYLDFGFKRIISENIKSNYLISIKDVSKVVELETQLHDAEIKSNQDSQMMLSILHIGPALFDDFMKGVEMELLVIESILREEEKHENLKDAVEIIFRSVHSLKGNAALLNLEYLANKANHFEDKMMLLRNKSKLDWEDFLPIAYELAILREVFIEMQELLRQILLFQNIDGERKTALSSLPRAIGELANQIAGELGKKITLDTKNLNFDGISDKYSSVLRDILVQLTRNSITHGIETPEIRMNNGKDQFGNIKMSIKKLGGSFSVFFRDDGKSFDLDALRKKAVSMGKATQDEINTWESSKLIKLIFEPGLSTASENTMHAGRGMGMDIIMERIKSLKGHLKLNFIAGQFTEFTFTFPVGTVQ
jgi:HPt (histidine-containing phosphotransfer) domain-containing protein